MAGFQTMDMPRPRFAVGVPEAPKVDVNLVRPRDVPIEIKETDGLARVTPALVQKIREMRADGHSHRAIALALRTAQGTVFDQTRDIPPPASGWRRGNAPVSFNIPKAQRMRRAGFSYREIADEFGVGRTAVRNKLRALDGEPKEAHTSGRNKATRAMEVVSGRLGIKRLDLSRDPKTGRCSGAPDIVKARHIVFWLLHRRVGMSSIEVGIYLGGFDHTTVLNGVRRAEEVARRLGINLEGQPTWVFRKLLAADWSARKAA